MADVGGMDVDCLNEAVRLLEGLHDALVVLQMPANRQVVPTGILCMIQAVIDRTLALLREATGGEEKP